MITACDEVFRLYGKEKNVEAHYDFLDAGVSASGIVVAALFLLFMMGFMLVGHMFWRGKWLALIPGNLLAASEEQGSTFQDGLGKRAAIASVLAALVCFCIATLILGGQATIDAVCTAASFGIAAGFIAIILFSFYMVIWANKQTRQKDHQHANEAYTSMNAKHCPYAQAKLNIRNVAGIIIAAIGMFLFYLFIIPLLQNL